MLEVVGEEDAVGLGRGLVGWTLRGERGGGGEGTELMPQVWALIMNTQATTTQP